MRANHITRSVAALVGGSYRQYGWLSNTKSIVLLHGCSQYSFSFDAAIGIAIVMHKKKRRTKNDGRRFHNFQRLLQERKCVVSIRHVCLTQQNTEIAKKQGFPFLSVIFWDATILDTDNIFLSVFDAMSFFGGIFFCTQVGQHWTTGHLSNSVRPSVQ